MCAWNHSQIWSFQSCCYASPLDCTVSKLRSLLRLSCCDWVALAIILFNRPLETGSDNLKEKCQAGGKGLIPRETVHWPGKSSWAVAETEFCSYQSPVQATAALIQLPSAGNVRRSHAVLIKWEAMVKIQLCSYCCSLDRKRQPGPRDSSAWHPGLNSQAVMCVEWCRHSTKSWWTR